MLENLYSSVIVSHNEYWYCFSQIPPVNEKILRHAELALTDDRIEDPKT